MRHLLSKAAGAVQHLHQQLDTINRNIASSMLGRSVSIRVGVQPPAHGIVAGVVVEDGAPKIVVNGACYDLSQVLTVTPLAFN
jgi:hypothetical protein